VPAVQRPVRWSDHSGSMMGTFPFTVVAMPLALWGVAGCAAASPVKTLVEGQTGTSGDDPRADTDALRKFATCRSAVFRLRRSQDGKGVGEASAHRAREATGTVTHGRGTSRRGTIWSGASSVEGHTGRGNCRCTSRHCRSRRNVICG
jgi:hypothetical protein